MPGRRRKKSLGDQAQEGGNNEESKTDDRFLSYQELLERNGSLQHGDKIFDGKRTAVVWLYMQNFLRLSAVQKHETWSGVLDYAAYENDV